MVVSGTEPKIHWESTLDLNCCFIWCCPRGLLEARGSVHHASELLIGSAHFRLKIIGCQADPPPTSSACLLRNVQVHEENLNSTTVFDNLPSGPTGSGPKQCAVGLQFSISHVNH